MSVCLFFFFQFLQYVLRFVSIYIAILIIVRTLVLHIRAYIDGTVGIERANERWKFNMIQNVELS